MTREEIERQRLVGMFDTWTDRFYAKVATLYARLREIDLDLYFLINGMDYSELSPRLLQGLLDWSGANQLQEVISAALEGKPYTPRENADFSWDEMFQDFLSWYDRLCADVASARQRPLVDVCADPEAPVHRWPKMIAATGFSDDLQEAIKRSSGLADLQRDLAEARQALPSPAKEEEAELPF